MIATKDFIFIHAPKTGGTFVMKILDELYKNDIKEIADKHAYSKDIPDIYRKLPKVLCLRDPLEWYESHYLYGWWRRYPETFPGFSKIDVNNLSFFDFIIKWNSYWAGDLDDFADENKHFGKLSYVTILYIFDNPNPLIEDIRKNGSAGFWERNPLPKNITILNTKNLNNDLYNFLTDFIEDDRLKKISLKEKKRVRPEDDPRGENEIETKKPKELIEYVEKREIILRAALKTYTVHRR